MPGCVLRVSGPCDRLRRSLAASPFDFEESARSGGSAAGSGESTGRCAFYHLVSDADGDHVPVQISDVIAFLSQHANALRSLRAGDGVEDACLDFGWNVPNTALAQFNRFPHSQLQLVRDLRIDIDVSVYVVYGPRETA